MVLIHREVLRIGQRDYGWQISEAGAKYAMD